MQSINLSKVKIEAIPFLTNQYKIYFTEFEDNKPNNERKFSVENFLVKRAAKRVNSAGENIQKTALIEAQKSQTAIVVYDDIIDIFFSGQNSGIAYTLDVPDPQKLRVYYVKEDQTNKKQLSGSVLINGSLKVVYSGSIEIAIKNPLLFFKKVSKSVKNKVTQYMETYSYLNFKSEYESKIFKTIDNIFKEYVGNKFNEQKWTPENYLSARLEDKDIVENFIESDGFAFRISDFMFSGLEAFERNENDIKDENNEIQCPNERFIEKNYLFSAPTLSPQKKVTITPPAVDKIKNNIANSNSNRLESLLDEMLLVSKSNEKISTTNVISDTLPMDKSSNNIEKETNKMESIKKNNVEEEIPVKLVKEEKTEEKWFCPECGTKNTRNFCYNCGTEKPIPHWICPKCGEDNDIEYKFCPECGQKNIKN